MDDVYAPKADFLTWVINDEVSLTGSDFADANLRRLIAFTRDADKSNRDWATMLLADLELDTPQVRHALLQAADDEDVDVRGEAIEGLARRDPAAALLLVQRELSRDVCGYGVFMAAALLANPDLVEALEAFDDETNGSIVHDALLACRTGAPFSSPDSTAG